jgi:hypothetical protein
VSKDILIDADRNFEKARLTREVNRVVSAGAVIATGLVYPPAALPVLAIALQNEVRLTDHLKRAEAEVKEAEISF